MALATTCPQCKTSFKVVPDQLKLRRGLVRCGVCQHVFSGIDYLRYVDDLARAVPRADPDRPPAITQRAHAAPATPPPTRTAPPRSTSAESTLTRPALPAPDSTVRTVSVEWEELLGRPAPARSAPAGPQTVVAPDADLKTAFFLPDTTVGTLPGSPGMASASPAPAAGPATLPRPITRLRPETRPESRRPADESPEPVRRGADTRTQPSPLATDADPSSADRDALAAPPLPRWAGGAEPAEDYRTRYRSRRSPAGLAGSPVAWATAGLLSLLLIGQTIVGWRNDLAARMPWLAPALQAVLPALGAPLSPPRALDALTIEGFELQTAGAPDRLQVTAMLRNRASYGVGFPAMELTLTDTTGQILVRTVIPAEAYLRESRLIDAGLAAGAEQPVRFALAHDGLQPTGYTVALFYP